MQYSCLAVCLVFLSGRMYDPVLSCLPTPADRYIFSEIEDKSKTSDDDGEFVEIWDPAGEGNASLDGYCIVTWINGGSGQSKSDTTADNQAQVLNIYSLDGYYTNSDGYFVLGGDALTTDASNCCGDSPFGYYNTNEMEFLPDGNEPDLVTALYYGGCNFTVGDVYTDSDIIQQNLIDALPTQSGPEQFIQLFDENWTPSGFRSFGTVAYSHPRCGDGCLSQMSQSGDCFTNEAPTPGSGCV